jgi:NAD(P)-dependent dehydrogenase (short-subunit alcohol dehydrogenase family)
MADPGPPAYYGTNFTPTTHTKVPANLDPSKVQLPKPFVVVVTGAGKGLGKHISLAYARAGCSGLCISSRTLSDLDKLESEVKTINPTIECLKSVCDVQDDLSVREMERGVRERWGRCDVVIANAGIISNYITPDQQEESRKEEGRSNLPIGIVEDEDWARVLNINLLGTWRISRAFMPLLTETEGGAKTLIASTSLAAHSIDSSLCPVAYNVSKFSINRLVEHIASDHGSSSSSSGIQAFALHPGAVLTPQTQGHKGTMWDDFSAESSDDEGLAGAMCVWLSKERRAWLSGRYVSCNWDVGELEGRKEEIVRGDMLKFRMVL